MKCEAEMFGGYHVAIYGGGVAIAITAPNGESVHMQGEEAALATDEYIDLATDIATNPNSRAARLGEKQIADEIFGVYF